MSRERKRNAVGCSSSIPSLRRRRTKLNLDEKAPQSIDPGDLYVQGTRLFPNAENTTPLTSPDKFRTPPRLAPKSRGPLSPFRRLDLP